MHATRLTTPEIHALISQLTAPMDVSPPDTPPRRRRRKAPSSTSTSTSSSSSSSNKRQKTGAIRPCKIVNAVVATVLFQIADLSSEILSYLGFHDRAITSRVCKALKTVNESPNVNRISHCIRVTVTPRQLNSHVRYNIGFTLMFAADNGYGHRLGKSGLIKYGIDNTGRFSVGHQRFQGNKGPYYMFAYAKALVYATMEDLETLTLLHSVTSHLRHIEYIRLPQITHINSYYQEEQGTRYEKTMNYINEKDRFPNLTQLALDMKDYCRRYQLVNVFVPAQFPSNIRVLKVKIHHSFLNSEQLTFGEEDAAINLEKLYGVRGLVVDMASDNTFCRRATVMWMLRRLPNLRSIHIGEYMKVNPFLSRYADAHHSLTIQNRALYPCLYESLERLTINHDIPLQNLSWLPRLKHLRCATSIESITNLKNPHSFPSLTILEVLIISDHDDVVYTTPGRGLTADFSQLASIETVRVALSPFDLPVTNDGVSVTRVLNQGNRQDGRSFIVEFFVSSLFRHIERSFFDGTSNDMYPLALTRDDFSLVCVCPSLDYVFSGSNEARPSVYEEHQLVMDELPPQSQRYVTNRRDYAPNERCVFYNTRSLSEPDSESDSDPESEDDDDEVVETAEELLGSEDEVVDWTNDMEE
jgi:hypothetical protein